MQTIVVTPRPQLLGADDFQAAIEGHPEVWGWGKTPNEAIGDLVRSYRDQFQIVIKEDLPKI